MSAQQLEVVAWKGGKQLVAERPGIDSVHERYTARSVWAFS